MKRFFIPQLVMLFSFWSLKTEAQVPVLNSLPGSGYVIYLDFDGNVDSSGVWSSASYPNPIVTGPAPLTSGEITEVFQRTAEDFRPFNINVTTDVSSYNAAPMSNRQRVVFTANSAFYTEVHSAAGGVAVIGSFGGGEIACYVFSNYLFGAHDNAEAASHEAGHTLGLGHHAEYNASCVRTYGYSYGNGSGQTSWGTIMGASYGRTISQWYHGAGSGQLCTDYIQNDLTVLTTGNGFSYRTDDAGNTQAAAANLVFSGRISTRKGVITTSNDIDVFKFTVSTTGAYSFLGVPASANASTNSGANLDVKLWLTNSSGTVLATGDPADRLDVDLPNITLTPGTYYVYIDGTGAPSYTVPGGVGSLDYGSLGEYTLTVTRSCAPLVTSTTPASRCGPGMVALKATASAGGTLRWFAAISGGTALATGATYTTPSISLTTTYYVSATSDTCAESSARIPVIATIKELPIVSAGPDQSKNQNTGTINLTGSPTGGTWSGNIVTSAGVFSTGASPGTYKPVYCFTSNGCTVCDTTLVTINPAGSAVMIPVITPRTGSYTAPVTVTIACATVGSTIYYTISGNNPVVGAGHTKMYTGPITASQNTTVRAIGVATAMPNSGIATSFLTINNPSVVATPVISPATGSYPSQRTVAMTVATFGASIYYTTNGNLPSATLNSFTKLYTGTFIVNSTTTVRAMGVMPGKTSSPVAVSYITITAATVATPVITPGTGSYIGSQSVQISCATPSASIYYTTTGNTPVVGTSFTKLYAGAIPITSSATIRAIATKTGAVNSGVAVAYLTLLPGRPSAIEALGNGRENVGTEPEETGLFVFPNPSSGVFYLKSEEEINNVAIFDMNGRKVKEIGPIKAGAVEIDLCQRPAGIYLLQAGIGGKSRKIKLVRE